MKIRVSKMTLKITHFFRPDFTVGSGITPESAFARGLMKIHITTGREFHPALKVLLSS
ncbi:hypothetical protein SDC9_157036 [bioreactor metagenome]|uniref:Uncharacterized protein n=1 Tax=bioreactor metagenome TaxID=1076179 RepID=A0A645FB14_9ZZZZ